MAIYKFSVGQKVKVSMEDRWIGDYEVPGVILSYGNVFLNGVPTYIVKTFDGSFLNEISENKICHLS
jgi:hypothetical protein